ncbi:protein kintoun isoform X3 [Bombus huntii]|uniref:protein kintoun isoform X3 n=1 Tax=Bombus huntii TaxID=85661 RepID=UPI0021AA3A55|nr:protein kintoun isoform X3 [Bombus huntii]
MDAYDIHRKNWEDLDVTKEELKNLTECLKKEEFRKMLIEYVEEVTDPKNMEVYQKEITLLEKKRGVDVTFVAPQPSYVIKTSINGDKKCFLNICTSELTDPPSSQPSFEQGHHGQQWSIPYLLTPPRDDLDKKNVRCKVFDVIFHPDTIFLSTKHAELRKIVNSTAIDGVENNFNVKLDRKNIKFPQIRYKGICHPTVIRKPSKSQPEEELDIEPEIYQKLMASYDKSRQPRPKRMEKVPKRSPSTKYYNKKANKSTDTDNKFTTPKFSIKHQSDVELEDFSTNRNAKMNATVPKRLIITIDLPLLKTATDASLDVQERYLSIKSIKPAKYLLELPLPYRVDADRGNAKFDAKHKKLVVTLPVIQPVVSVSNTKEDSGVNSDPCNFGNTVPLLLEDSMEDSSSQSHESNCTPKLVEECETVLATTKTEYESKNVEDSPSQSHESNCTPKLVEECETVLATTKTEYESENVEDSPSQSHESNCTPKLVEECETVLATTKTEYESENVEDSSDTTLRTSKKNISTFLDPSIKYSLPTFICNLCKNQLTITVNLKNVNPDSIRYRILQNNLGIHALLTSVGTGFFPQHYSLCLKITENSVNPDSVTVEPWDNNVVFTIMLKDMENVEQYYVGIDEEFMEQKHFSNVACFENQLEKLTTKDDDEANQGIEVQTEDGGFVINISPNHLDTDDEAERHSTTSMEERPNLCHTVTKTRSVSESSGDELIISESSADEIGTAASSIDCHYDSIPDLNSELDCSSLKKTVRFNDVVSRQLFRSNSSILGQRKKNQRKLRNKRRAYERKMSESEISETEDRDKYKGNQKNTEVSETVTSIKEEMNEIRSNNSDDTAKDEVKAQFKNDLIFDLDM